MVPFVTRRFRGSAASYDPGVNAVKGGATGNEAEPPCFVSQDVLALGDAWTPGHLLASCAVRRELVAVPPPAAPGRAAMCTSLAVGGALRTGTRAQGGGRNVAAKLLW